LNQSNVSVRLGEDGRDYREPY